MADARELIATGRRKTSVARIRMMPGTGKIDIKEKESKREPTPEEVVATLKSGIGGNRFAMHALEFRIILFGKAPKSFDIRRSPDRCQCAGSLHFPIWKSQ